jgi:hypothetical protein
MTPVRLVFYIVDPFTDDRRPIAALLGNDGNVVVVRAPLEGLPAYARANAGRVLVDLDTAVTLSPLPQGAGAHAVGGEILVAPVPLADAPAWVRASLLTTAA